MKGITAEKIKPAGRAAADRLKRIISERGVHTAMSTFLALAVSGAPAFLGVTPFGVALLCSVEELLPLLTVSLCLGAALRGVGLLIPIYIILLLFRLITSMWIGEENNRVNTALCAVGMTTYGLFRVLTLPGGAALVHTAVGTAVAVLLCLCYQGKEMGTVEKRAFLLAMVYTAACASADIRLYGIDIGNVLGFIICMNLARQAGGTFGCAAGALWGLGCAPEYAPAFAVGALIGGRTDSTLLGVGAGAVFCMLFATFTGGYYGIRDFLPDITVAASLYAPLSRFKWMRWELPSFDDPEEDAQGEAKRKERRLAAVAGALGSLSAIFYGMSDRLRQRDGYESSTDMTGAFADDYAAMSELICSALDREDSSSDRVTAGKVYGMLRMYRIRCSSVRAWEGRIKRVRIEGMQRSVMNDPKLLQERVSNICAASFAPPSFSVSEKGVSALLESLPTLSAECSTASARKPGEDANGDCATSFTTEDGYFYCVLCDGMGSGKDAAIASRTCCVFLRKMLEGGVDAALSVRMLNTFLRGKGYECFATVDIFCLDLYTADAFFIKGGSAPSHLFRSGCEYTMASATAPVGIIREVYAEKIAFRVMEGDLIVMQSDGVEEDKPPKPPANTCAEKAAKELLADAMRRGGEDDTTVCVIKISEPEPDPQ